MKTLFFSDVFERLNSTSVGSDYTEGAGDWQISGSNLILSSTSGTPILAFWYYITYDALSGNSPTSDYDVEVTFNASAISDPLVGLRYPGTQVSGYPRISVGNGMSRNEGAT